MDAPFHPATQPLKQGDGSGKIDCNNPDCFTSVHHTRTQGNRQCIDYFCPKCCKSAHNWALLTGTPHPKCHGHNVQEVIHTYVPGADRVRPTWHTNNAAPAQAPLPAVIDPVLAAFQSQPTATQLQVPVAQECVQMPRQAE